MRYEVIIPITGTRTLIVEADNIEEAIRGICEGDEPIESYLEEEEYEPEYMWDIRELK